MAGTPRAEDIWLQLLALRCRRGDAEALAALVREFQDRLLYYLRRLVDSEDDAWDVLQQTRLGVFRGIRSMRDPERLVPWLYRIARNTAARHLRHRLVDDGTQDDSIDLDTVEGPEDPPVADGIAVHEELGTLSVAHREVLVLHFLEDLSVAEIAEIVGVPAGTVKSRLHYARRRLRDALGEEA
ncbi:MAG: RNA polymerase sigma factor [Armatimonadota bacterium]